jgi:hypothetical protein
MAIRLLGAAVLALACASAQHGTTAKPKPGDYPVQARAGDLVLAGEYLVRSAGSGDAMFGIPEHLVFEVALYPPKGTKPLVSAGHFSLRVNGKRQVLHPQTAGIVAAALKYPDWSTRPQLTGVAGMGDGAVVIGRPRQVERFPGDRRPVETRLPGSTREPVRETATRPPEEMVVEAALPEGPATGPVSGYLYFAFKDKPKKIKSLELLYNTGTTQAVLKFF